MSTIRLQLFVAGTGPRSERAIADLERICASALEEAYEIEVVDVVDAPERADDARILTTPTVLKTSPEPIRKIIGDLGDVDKVLNGLGLHAHQNPTAANDA